VVAEELRTVVRVDLQDGEGHSQHDVLEGVPHHQVAAPQHRYPLTPTGGHIDELHGVHVLPGGLGAAMVN